MTDSAGLTEGVDEVMLAAADTVVITRRPRSAIGQRNDAVWSQVVCDRAFRAVPTGDIVLAYETPPEPERWLRTQAMHAPGVLTAAVLDPPWVIMLDRSGLRAHLRPIAGASHVSTAVLSRYPSACLGWWDAHDGRRFLPSQLTLDLPDLGIAGHQVRIEISPIPAG